MANHTVQVTDSRDNTFFISAEIPFKEWNYPHGSAGRWRSLNYGFILPNFGGMWWEVAQDNSMARYGITTTKHLSLLNKGYWGMKFWEYRDVMGVNPRGSGIVLQSWVLGIEPGRITWEIYE